MASRALPTPPDMGNARRPLRDAARARIEDQISNALADVELWIAKLDALDGDTDLEETGAEDDFSPHPFGTLSGPGCPLADPDEGVDDIACDPETEVFEEVYVDPAAYRAQRDRIRRDRCIKLDKPFSFAGQTYGWILRADAGVHDHG